VEVTAKDPSNL